MTIDKTTTRIMVTDTEKQRYSPYHTMAAFTQGYFDYTTDQYHRELYISEINKQAWDRGYECAMIREQSAHQTKIAHVTVADAQALRALGITVEGAE